MEPSGEDALERVSDYFRTRQEEEKTMEATNPSLRALSALIGEWTTEATHPAFPSTVVLGRSTFEWLEGERFLIARARSDHPDFPDSISIIGDAGGLRCTTSTHAGSPGSTR
jgi:hypothetical protein